ncbi:MAG: FtsW/RodA/SpoVE family cell cycle protein [Candidatus Nanopelagicales bacterium]
MSAPAPVAARPAPAPPKQPTRRNAELGLLLLVWGIGAMAIIASSLGATGDIEPSVWRLLSMTGAAFLMLHLVIRRLASYADPVILPTVVALNMLGIAMIYRLDVNNLLRAERNDRPAPSLIANNQVTWLALGVIACAFVLIIVRDHRNLRRFTYLCGFVGIGLLLLPLVPGLGLTIRGANLWIAIGPFTFQPAELAKVFLVIFFASYLVLKRDSLALIRRKILGLGVPRGRDLGPIVVAWLIALGIVIFQTDLGTAVMFFGLFVGLLYVATGRRSWIVLGFLMTLAGAVGSYTFFGHVRIRVKVWMDPFAYADREGYQIVQAMFGFANGGTLGTGWGRGFPQQVPFAESDFIFAALGEEIGLVGVYAVVILFAVLIQRCLRLARSSRDPFGALLATGFAIVFGLQTFVVLGGVTKLIPHTGLTTPFMSAGGSSLLANWIIVGLLLRISDQVRRPDPVIIPPDDETTQLASLTKSDSR